MCVCVGGGGADFFLFVTDNCTCLSVQRLYLPEMLSCCMIQILKVKKSYDFNRTT